MHYVFFRVFASLLVLLAMAGSSTTIMAAAAKPRYLMYFTGQHPIAPAPALVQKITHVALAFMSPRDFNGEPPSSWPDQVKTVRKKFFPGTKIMVAIGGWGDTEGFSVAAKTVESRERFAKNVADMVKVTGADGVDIDWEYPGGNGEDYKTVPNSSKAWEITAYPLLLQAIRSAIGPKALISAAVPGLPRDMLAFTRSTIPTINTVVDFLNIMTYDLMNRRDNITKHHTGVQLSLEAIDAYAAAGFPINKMNLGFAFYLKWFYTSSVPEEKEACRKNPVGCKTPLMEDPETGGDLGRGGGFSWHDGVPGDVKESFDRAMEKGTYDAVGGGHYYWDEGENRWWTWDTPEAIVRKFPEIVEKRGVGGVFAWGLGEDAEEWVHLKALTDGFVETFEGRRDEL